MPANRCLFRKEWLSKNTWILDGDSKSIAVCKSCKKTVKITIIREATIASNMNIKRVLSATNDHDSKTLASLQLLLFKRQLLLI